jgi:riboflavin synthase
MGIFTGLIMEVGRVRRIDRRAAGAYLEIEARAVVEGTRVGDSISINGVDLTVIEMGNDFFSADASLETLARSTLGALRVGSRVNLERALAVGERLGGHMVQGHVDGTGRLVSVKQEGNAYRMRFGLAQELSRYVALKGSIAVDGWFEVAVIPHTWRETTLRELKAGDPVNIEVDVLAKYVERLMEHGDKPSHDSARLTVEYLSDLGY